MWAILANQATLLRTTWRFMKASGEVVRRTSSLRNCDLYDVVGYRWSGTFFRSEEFLSQFSDPNHIIGDWSVVCEVGREIYACLRSSSFRASSLKACGQWKWIVFSWPFTLSAVWFPFYESVGSWMTVNCNRLIRSPNSALEFVMSMFLLPWSR